MVFEGKKKRIETKELKKKTHDTRRGCDGKVSHTIQSSERVWFTTI